MFREFLMRRKSRAEARQRICEQAFEKAQLRQQTERKELYQVYLGTACPGNQHTFVQHQYHWTHEFGSGSSDITECTKCGYSLDAIREYERQRIRNNEEPANV